MFRIAVAHVTRFVHSCWILSLGGTNITLSGTNFGVAPSVTVGPNLCTFVARSRAQGSNLESYVCRLPAGQGASLPVTVCR